MSEKNKNILIFLIVIIMFIVMIVGASYAYFNSIISITSSTTNVNTEFENVGIATLNEVNNLKLNLAAPDMMEMMDDVTYYATLSGMPTQIPTSEIIATANVAGNGTMYCDYEINVSLTGTNNLYTAFKNMDEKSNNQLVLNVNGTDYDFINTDFPLTIRGRIEDLKEGINQHIKASFEITNKKEIDQSDLKAKDLTITFSVSEFKCHITG